MKCKKQNSLGEKIRTVFETAQAVVARRTKQTANLVAAMAMVNMQATVALVCGLRRLTADKANPFLFGQKFVEGFKGYSERLHKILVQQLSGRMFGVPFPAHGSFAGFANGTAIPLGIARRFFAYGVPRVVFKGLKLPAFCACFAGTCLLAERVRCVVFHAQA